jgi:hypothetical protein
MKKIIFLSAGILIGGTLLAQTTPWNVSGSHIYSPNAGNVGVGTTTPDKKLTVAGTIRSATTNTVAFFTQSDLGLSLQQANINNDFVNADKYLSILSHNMDHNGTNWIRRNTYGNAWASVYNQHYYDLLFTPDNPTGTHNESVNPTSYFRVSSNGKVGVGTITPTEKLTVNGHLHVGDFTTGIGNGGANALLRLNERATLQSTVNGANDWTRAAFAQNIQWNNTNQKWDIPSSVSDFAMLKYESNGNVAIYTGTNTSAAYSITETELKQYQRFWITGDGRVCIGNINPGGYKLAVDGKVVARELKVTLNSWADHVFNKDYKLMSLAELEAFIKKNNHLPDIPSAKEVVEKEGIELGTMNAKLLEKIEELTLHMIEVNKQVSTLTSRVQLLERENTALKQKK